MKMTAQFFMFAKGEHVTIGIRHGTNADGGGLYDIYRDVEPETLRQRIRTLRRKRLDKFLDATGEYHTNKQLADRYFVSERTIASDLKALKRIEPKKVSCIVHCIEPVV